MSRRDRTGIDSAIEALPGRSRGYRDIEPGCRLRSRFPSSGSDPTMSVQGFVYRRILDGLDETTTIVVGLRRFGYSIAEIAKAIDHDEYIIEHIIRSVSAQVLAERGIAEDLLSHISEKKLLTSLIDEWASPGQVNMQSGGLSDDESARAHLRGFREEWFRAGICTTPADRPCAENAVMRLYTALGLASPPFIWCDSPMAAQQILTVLERAQRSRRTARPAAQPGAWLGDVLRGSRSWMQAALQGSRRDWLNSVLRGTLPTYEVRALLAVASEDVLWGTRSARELLYPALTRALSESLRDWRKTFCATPLRYPTEADWIERFLFFRDVVGVHCAPHLSDRLDWWADIARSCLWWWPYRKACVVCERPAEIHSPDGRSLHNDAGPAVRFRDGWSIWAIDGVMVDEQIVLRPDSQSLQQIHRERNAEVKRIRIERYGWERYLADVGAVVLDRRRNNVEATRETLLRTPNGETVLVCACPSTARVYVLAVPPDIRTCRGAQAWLSGGLAGRIINGA
jgi:hypothetical protein